MSRFALILVALLAVGLGSAGPARALELGFNDEDVTQPILPTGVGVDDAGMRVALADARNAGATRWRVLLRWSVVAPTQPPDDRTAADPSWGGYQWDGIDRAVRAIVGAGLRPLPWISAAPDWAEGPGRPPVSTFFPPGTWRPNAAALRNFAAAVARRYSGTFPDPLTPGAVLPRIDTFQAWNEPNLYTHVTPQYTKTAAGYENTSADIFRTLVNAIYDGVKSVAPSDTIVSGATAPFGDYPDGGHRTPPAEFWRNLLCVKTTGTRVSADPACPKIRFDAYAHNPYTPYPPDQKGLNADDVTVPDIGEITSSVKAGVRARIIQPAGTKPLWITELGWDSRPDPDGLSLPTQARYTQGAIALLARQGAQVILFWNSRDDAPVPSYDTSRQSGIFFRGATPAQDTKKPSWTAYRFPMTAYRSRGRTLLWGKAPAPGLVTVQRQSGGVWKTYLKLAAGPDGVFSKRVRTSPTLRFRAVQGSFISLVATH